MAWAYNQSTPNDYHWYGLNYMNQEAGIVTVSPGENFAITGLSVFAAARTSAVLCKVALWDISSGGLIAQTATFTMGVGSESVGGQAWQSYDITAVGPIATGTSFFVGLYRNPGGAHIGGTHTGLDSYLKTNTAGYPSVVSLNGYTFEGSEGLCAAIKYVMKPAAQTGFSTTRNSDTSQTIAWTNNVSADRPYDTIQVNRWDNVTNGWYYLTGLAGSATSYTDTTTQANRQYQYAVRGMNSCDSGDWLYGNYHNTTPAAPSSVVAISSGTNVQLTWVDNSTNENHFKIQSSTYSGGWGAWTDEVEVAAGAQSWTDTTPPTRVKYRVRSFTDTYGSLNSAYVESNDLQTLQAPNPPSNLLPNNTAFDATLAKTFTWQHNPTDGSAQTAYSIQYKLAGGSYPGGPQVYAEMSSVSQHVFPAGTFTNGNTYKYQIYTWGAYTGDSSDWSAEMTFYASTTPVGTITSPSAASNYTNSTLTMTWNYSDADSDTQVQYVASLYDNNGLLLETKQAASALTSVTFDTKLLNASTYNVSLQVQDDTGLWSGLSAVEFDTLFAVPPTPTIVVTPDELTATMQIAITNPSPAGAEIEAVYNDVYRSVDEGLTYEKILTNVALNTTVTDYIPNIGDHCHYYIQAISATPTSANSLTGYATLTCTGLYCLNTGSDYSDYILLFRESALTENFGYETLAQQFEGRTYKTRFQSEHKINEIAFTAEILASEVAQLKLVIENTANIHYRDYTGRWFNCAIINPNIQKKDFGRSYAFNCTISRLEDEAYV